MLSTPREHALPFTRLISLPAVSGDHGRTAAGARLHPRPPVPRGEAPAAPLTSEQDDWIARRRAQAARANAALPEIIAEMRERGALKPLPRAELRTPLFKRGPLDADYWDTGQTIEDGE